MQVRSLSALGLMAVLAACGGGGGKKNPDNPQNDSGIDNSGMDSGSGDDDQTVSCAAGENDPGYPKPTKTQVWTDAQFEACYTACQDAPDFQACIDSKCDAGANDFFDCLDEGMWSCLSRANPEGSCRDEWVSFICCEASKCVQTDTDAQCFAKCKTEADQFAGTNDPKNPGCTDTVYANANTAGLRDPCLDEVGLLCFKPGGATDAGPGSDAGMTPDDAGTKTDAGTTADAGTKPDAGMKTITSVRLPPSARRELARQLHALTR